MDTKTVKLRWAATCASCDKELAAGVEATWSRAARQAHCLDCTEPGAEVAVEPETPALSEELPLIDRGEAGASARREYERRSAREAARKQKLLDEDREWRTRVKAERPVLGRVATALTARPKASPTESHATTAWKTGEAGELRVGEILEACQDIALHDRRIPGSKANIDHIAVGSSGVFVIDAKKYKGRIEKRDVGGLFRLDERLYVRGRDQSKLIAGVQKQCDVVRTALGEQFQEVPVHGILCFVEAEWGIRMRRVRLGATTCVWPKGLPKLVDAEGSHDADARETIAHHLAEILRPA